MIGFVVKSTISLLVFYGCYYFLLRNEKSFVFNRFFLLCGLIFSVVLPFIDINIAVDYLPSEVENFVFSLPENIVTDFETTESFSVPEEQNSFSTAKIIWGIYLVGVLAFLIKYFTQLYKIRLMVRQNKTVFKNGYKIVLLREKTGPFSFMNYIFINKENLENREADNALLQHEIAHVKQFHTIDILITELIRVILWFNPFVLLFRNVIKLNHEFLADDKVVKKYKKVSDYQTIIFQFIENHMKISLISNFKFSFTKKRIIMLSRQKNRYRSIAKNFLLLLVTVFLFLHMSVTVVAQEKRTSKKEWKESMRENQKKEDWKIYQKISPNLLRLSNDQLRKIGFEIDNDGIIFGSKYKGDEILERIRFFSNKFAYGVDLSLEKNDDKKIIYLPDYFPVAIFKDKKTIFNMDERRFKVIPVVVKGNKNLKHTGEMTLLLLATPSLQKKLSVILDDVEKYIVEYFVPGTDEH